MSAMWEKQTGPAWNIVQATAFTPLSGPLFDGIQSLLNIFIFQLIVDGSLLIFHYPFDAGVATVYLPFTVAGIA
jgi:hypothetical protein